MSGEAYFDESLYQETSSKINILKAKLPEAELRLIAKEVLDRVSARHKLAREQAKRIATSAEIEELVNALVDVDMRAGVQFITKLQGAGVSKQDIYLSYLSVSAARLGEMWDDDLLSLVDVTLGTSRIFGILRSLGKFESDNPSSTSKRAIFVATPGETHTLGVSMAADLFTEKGWHVELLVGMSHEDIIAQIEHSDIGIIGISAGGLHTEAALTRLILAIRFCRPDALVMLSGQIVEGRKDLVDAMALDGIATDVPSALRVMDSLLDIHMPNDATIN